MEDEANYFASSFLMPAKSFSEELISHTLDYYLLLKKRWQISIQAMIYRSRELNIINDYQASYLWKQIAKKGWRTQEPYDDLLQSESPLLLKEAIDLIIDNHVKTKKQICEEVRLCQSDIEAIVNLPVGYLDENKGKGTVISFKKI
ncbi:ImmA/IrrE family metallo-endopeptidase [Bacillus cereus]|nr:ImmA/IrrE family metallo-endopeptidase [Bacillus thuringiensis]